MEEEAVLKRIVNGEEEPKYLSLALLQRITNNFSDERIIGQGGFGVVYKGVYNNGEEIAVKLFHDDDPALGNEQFKNECFNLLRIKHPNIVRLLGYCYETKREHVEYNGDLWFAQHRSRILCFEYLQRGSLDKYLYESGHHDWPTRYNIIKGTCEGLNFLHGQCEPQVLHLDLKPANILLDMNMGVKLADFGLARNFSETNTRITKTIKGTMGYMAPEYIANKPISPENDVYSLGVIILEITDGHVGYSEFGAMDDVKPFIEQVTENWGKWINPTTSLCPSAELDQVRTCVKLALKCVAPEKTNRPTVAEILYDLQETEKSILEERRNRAGFLVDESLPTTSGSRGGTAHDIREKPRHQRLTIRFAFIASICFAVLLLSIWRLYGYAKTETICFSPSEFVEEISGAYGCHSRNILSAPVILKGQGLQVPEKLSNAGSGRGPLDVVIVYAFDCTNWTSAWYTLNKGIFWMVQEKLTHFADSCLGYIYVMSTPNTYTSDMKVVDPADAKTGYKVFQLRTMTCTKNMASGLAKAHKMISSCGHHNSIILFFSDGLVNKGDFFDGTDDFVSKVPVHTFTLAGHEYNNVLHSIAANSPGGKFHTTPVPDRPNLSPSFSKLLDSLLGGTLKDDEKPPSPITGREPLDVVIVYAFDCTNSTPAWYTANSIFSLVEKKLTHFVDSCLGYIYFMSTPNTHTSDMKVVGPAETKETAWRSMTCTKNMASGLAEAHKMITNRGYHNGIILFFSDGLINEGDFFDGTENFISKVPVHTFTLGGDAYNHGLQAIAANSPGGTFNPFPVPKTPHLSSPFSKLLDRLLSGTMKD